MWTDRCAVLGLSGHAAAWNNQSLRCFCFFSFDWNRLNVLYRCPSSLKQMTRTEFWMKEGVGGQYLYVGEESLYRRQAIWEEKRWREARRQGLSGEWQPLVAVSGCRGAHRVLLCEENQWQELQQTRIMLKYQQFISNVQTFRSRSHKSPRSRSSVECCQGSVVLASKP